MTVTPLTTFLRPHVENRLEPSPKFDGLPILGKIHIGIEILSPHSFIKSSVPGNSFVIGNTGFPTHRDGTFVFVTRFEPRVGIQGFASIGFTSTSEHDRNVSCWPSQVGMNGVTLTAASGTLWSGNGRLNVISRSNLIATKIFDENVTSQAKEIVSILTISEGGERFMVQFIADGDEGPISELSKTVFVNECGGDQIFPVVTAWQPCYQFGFISFDEVTFFSPRIEELMAEYRSNENSNNETHSAMASNSSKKKKPSSKKVGVVIKPAKQKQQPKKKPSAKTKKTPKKATKSPKLAAKKAGKKVTKKPQVKKAKKTK